MKEIKTIEGMKDEFRRAKLMNGDLRGLSNRFELSKKLGIAALHTFYYSTGRFETRQEIVVDIGESGYRECTMKGMVESLKKEITPVEVQFICLTWNKNRSEADHKNLILVTYNP